MDKEEVCFYSVNDFAKLLSTSPACVRKLIRKGQIKSLKLNSAKRAKHRIPISELYRLSSSVYGEEND
jgi:hypothetical protein